MTLLIAVFAAIISTVVWYLHSDNDQMKISILCFMYWGASMMWFIDAVFEYMELKEAYFQPAITDMVNDAFLGFSAVALGLLIWLVVVLIKDPKNSMKHIIFR